MTTQEPQLRQRRKDESGILGGTSILTFTVKDLAAARRFYADGLGLEVGREEEGRFFLARGGGASLLCEVPDTAAAAAELEARGVEFTRVVGERIGDYLELRDPEGTRIVLAERL